jgi:hypothetical protein
MQVKVIDHPLVLRKLSLIRRKETSTNEFRMLARELGPMLLYEATAICITGDDASALVRHGLCSDHALRRNYFAHS